MAKPVDTSAITDPERIWSKIDPSGVCWEWTAGRNAGGYGRFKVGGRSTVAHRVVYAFLVGDVPGHLDLDHLCRNRGCVNPDHLEPVDRHENWARGAGPHLDWRGGRKKQAVCGAGLHSMTDPENVYVSTEGRRCCKPCKQVRSAKYYQDRARGNNDGVLDCD